MKAIITTIFLLAFIPKTLYAQVTDIFSAEALIITILGKIGYLFWLLAIMMFFWGLVKFIKHAADTKEHEEGKHLIIWGLISFLVLVSLWAIVQTVLVNTLGINSAPVCYIQSNGTKLDGTGAPC